MKLNIFILLLAFFSNFSYTMEEQLPKREAEVNSIDVLPQDIKNFIASYPTMPTLYQALKEAAKNRLIARSWRTYGNVSAVYNSLRPYPIEIKGMTAEQVNALRLFFSQILSKNDNAPLSKLAQIILFIMKHEKRNVSAMRFFIFTYATSHPIWLGLAGPFISSAQEAFIFLRACTLSYYLPHVDKMYIRQVHADVQTKAELMKGFDDLVKKYPKDFLQLPEEGKQMRLPFSHDLFLLFDSFENRKALVTFLEHTVEIDQETLSTLLLMVGNDQNAKQVCISKQLNPLMFAVIVYLTVLTDPKIAADLMKRYMGTHDTDDTKDPLEIIEMIKTHLKELNNTDIVSEEHLVALFAIIKTCTARYTLRCPVENMATNTALTRLISYTMVLVQTLSENNFKYGSQLGLIMSTLATPHTILIELLAHFDKEGAQQNLVTYLL